jgi:ribonuclease T2
VLQSTCGNATEDSSQCDACLGRHQLQLRMAGCSGSALQAFCQGPSGRGGTPGDFDLYVLTQSWQPEFCFRKSYPGCLHPNASEYMFKHLTLHGLWPQYSQTRGGSTYPFDCSSEQFDPSVLSQVQGGRAAIETYWPNVKASPGDWASYSSFCQHEWTKHGTCTKLSQLDYFNFAIYFLQQAGTPQVITSNVGGSVPKAQIIAAYGGAKRVSLSCGGGSFLGQVMTCWGLDNATHAPTTRVDCPTAVLQEDSCPGSSIQITAFSSPPPSPPSPPPPPPPQGGSSCLPNQHGPLCTADAQCLNYANCLRCATSGYCTNMPAQ